VVMMMMLTLSGAGCGMVGWCSRKLPARALCWQ